MKKLIYSLIFSTLLLASCQNISQSTAPQSIDTTIVATPSYAPVAYIDIDSLMMGYDLYTELRNIYEKRVRAAESKLAQAGKKIKKDIADYQEKVQKGLITRSQAASMEQELALRQRDFYSEQEKTMNELTQGENELLGQIQSTIIKYLKEFNKDGRYSMILSNSQGGVVLNALPELNITSEVRVGLNERYRAKNKK